MIKLIYNLIFIVLLSLNFSISHADKKFEKNLNKQKKKLNKLPKAYSEESKIIDKAIIEIDKTNHFKLDLIKNILLDKSHQLELP